MSDFTLPDDHILLSFPPRLRKNIKEIWTDGKIGISSMNMKIHLNPTKMHVEDYPVPYKDNFILEIPYAGKILFWEVIFKDEDYDYPPDFEFPHDSFLYDPDINIISDYIPSLANWNVNNPKSLVSVIKEFMMLYKKFQVMRLQTENRYSRLFTEYEFLIAELDSSENNVEVYIDNSGTVHFLFSININFSCLPPYIQPVLTGKADNLLNPNEDTATLRVSFNKPDSSKVQCDLQLSPRLEQVVGSSSILHIPNFNKDHSLFGYVTQVTKLLEERVEQIANHYKLKNEYISFILSFCGCTVIEYDNTLFSKAVLLCEMNNFYTLVFIHIANKFPQEKPKVILRSVYHLQHEKAFFQNLDNYPYSPRWKPEEMVRRLIDYLQEEIPKFQTVCQNIVPS